MPPRPHSSTHAPRPIAPFGESFAADAFAVWDRLRVAGPVHRVTTPDGPPAWLVTRYADVRAGLLDPRLSVWKAAARGEDYKGFTLPPALDAHLLNREPPDHTRLRKLIAPALSARRITDLRDRVQSITDQLLDTIARRGRADLIADLAIPLPLLVACELLGVPDADRDHFRGWAAALLVPDPEQAPRARDTLPAMLEIVTGLIEAKRAHPGEDLVSALIAARDAEDRLSGDELTSMLFYVLFVWYEVSVDLFGSAMLALLRHPDQLAALRKRPDLLPAAVEELLRYEAPQALAAPRFPTEEVEIAGVRIPAGDTVLLCLASANRDPERFTDPDLLDVARTDNPQLSFGLGIHTCLGAPLVRLETEIVLTALLARLPGLKLAVDAAELRWRPGFRHRGLYELPVTW